MPVVELGSPRDLADPRALQAIAGRLETALE